MGPPPGSSLGEGQSPEMAALGEERANMRGQTCLTAPRIPWLQLPTFLSLLPTKTSVGTLWPLPNSRKHSLAAATRQGTSGPFSPTSPKYPENSTWLLMQIVMEMLSPGPVTKTTSWPKDKIGCPQAREHSLPHGHQPRPEWSLLRNRLFNPLMPIM